MFVAIGTVYPANQFAVIAKAAGAVTVEINLKPSGGMFDRSWTGSATQCVPKFVDQIILENHRGVVVHD
jgi:NAD-dependent deacetylase